MRPDEKKFQRCQALPYSKSQFDAVLAAARPLAVGNRDAFLQVIVDVLQGVWIPATATSTARS
jgi:hypothetical protein